MQELIIHRNQKQKRNMNKDKPFVRRMYQKQELALLYFPHLRPHAATNRLLRWINHCGELRRELQLTFYNTHARYFTVRQVDLIVYYLGEPG